MKILGIDLDGTCSVSNLLLFVFLIVTHDVRRIDYWHAYASPIQTYDVEGCIQASMDAAVRVLREQ